MSIPVELSDLQAKTSEYTWAYLLTVRPNATPHLVSLSPQWVSNSLLMSVSPGTGRNASAGDKVTLCYPPLDHDGYSLIVDGTADLGPEAGGSGRGAEDVRGDDRHDAADVEPVPDGKVLLRFTPIGAVLHRSAAPGFSNSATGCANDCLPIEQAG